LKRHTPLLLLQNTTGCQQKRKKRLLVRLQGLNQEVNHEASPSQFIQGCGGNFYGVTLMGTFFRLISDGQRTVIAAFDRNLLPNSLV
jgi:hypothetical protein